MGRKMMQKSLVTIKSVVHWLLLAFALLIVLTGFGIVEYQLVTAITFGLLNKDLSFQIHINLWPIFLILLVLHMYLTARSKSFEAGKTPSP